MFPHVFKNTLPPSMFERVWDAINPEDNAWTLSNTSLGREYRDDSISWKIFDHGSIPQFQSAGTYIQYKLNKHYHKFTGVMPDFKLTRIFTNGQTSNQSTIFHTDSPNKYDYTVVLFTELSWDVTFGGEFVCQDPDGAYHYAPYIPNTAVLIPGCWYHRGTPPHRMTDRMRTTLALSYTDPNCPFDHPLL